MNREIDEILCSTLIDTRVSVNTWRPNPWDSAGVLSENYMFCHVAGGHGNVRINEETYDIKPGILIFLTPGASFSITQVPPGDLLLYSCRFKVPLDSAFRLLEIPSCVDVRDRRVPEMLQELAQSSEQGEEDLFSPWCWVYSALGYLRSEGLLRLNAASGDPARTALTRIISFMKANINKRISMSVLGALVFRERSFVHRVFRDHLHATPMSYFRGLQMTKAKQLLYQGKTVKETATELGYGDAFSFSKAFRRHFGASPEHFSTANTRHNHHAQEPPPPDGGRTRRLWEVHPRLPLFRRRVLAWSYRSFATGWEDTVAAQGVIQCGKEFGDVEMLSWGKAWADYHLAVPIKELNSVDHMTPDTGQGIVLSSYCGSWGAPLAMAPLYEAAADHMYLIAVSSIAEYIMTHSVRKEDGTIVHGGFTDNVWVDTPYFTSAVLASSYAVTRLRRYAVEAIRQCLNHARYLRDEVTRCFVHDIDLEKHVRSKWLWGRGNGWILLALADTLAACPPVTRGYDELLQVYRELAGGLIRFQHPSGLWKIIIDDPDSHLETSGSAMILGGLAIGIKNCWLDESLLDNVLQGFQELLTWIYPEGGQLQGAFMGAEKPAGPGGWEHHKYIELGECRYATGLFLRLLAEIRRLGITVQF